MRGHDGLVSGEAPSISFEYMAEKYLGFRVRNDCPFEGYWEPTDGLSKERKIRCQATNKVLRTAASLR